MFDAPYDIGPIRPPSEAGSLLVRVSRNCPWNRCAFCNVYKGTRFEKKSVEEVKKDIDAAARFYGGHGRTIRTAFLQDANPLATKPEVLAEVLKYLREKFPSIERVTAYARADTLARRSVEDLRGLREAGLDRVHVGMETGYGPLLEFIDKGTTPEQQVEGGRKAKEAGMELSEYVMPGLGGREMSEEHARATAEVLNRIDPDFIRLRTASARPGTPLYEKLEAGLWTPLTEEETVGEIRDFLDGLEGITSRVVSDHMLNLLQEIEGKLPEEKERMLGAADRYLEMQAEEKEHFMVGSRTGAYRRLEDMGNALMRERVRGTQEALREEALRQDPTGGVTVERVLRKAMEEIL